MNRCLQKADGYRPNRSAKDAILKVKKYAEQGYTFAVVLDLSKYFDTLNHEILINLLRKNVKDERVVQLIKRYLGYGGRYRSLHGQGLFPEHPHDADGANHDGEPPKAAEICQK